MRISFAILLSFLPSLFPMQQAIASDYSSFFSLTYLKQIYDAQCAALVSGDLNDWADTMAPSYVLMTADAKRLTREELLANVRKSLSGLRWTQCTASIRKIWRSGTTGDVLVTNSGRAISIGSNPSKEIETGADSIDSWTIVNGKLLQTASVDLNSTLSVAGRVISLSRLPALNSSESDLSP